jgi:hypothetical protein
MFRDINYNDIPLCVEYHCYGDNPEDIVITYVYHNLDNPEELLTKVAWGKIRELCLVEGGLE